MRAPKQSAPHADRPGRSETEQPNGSRREDILVAAARLFADVGYENTTMTDIARAAGLDQSSLYYWFRRKELILQATLSVNRLPVEFLERISAEEGSPVLKLYRLLKFDIYQLCSSPFDINEIERQAERQPDVFKAYWQDNQELFEGVCHLIRLGIETGELIECDSTLAALTLLSTHEGIQKRFRYQSRHRNARESPFVYPRFSVMEVAISVAANSVRALLRRPGDLSRITALASTFEDF
jgi:TetR/AcrR family transcriptional regulator